MSFEIFLMHIKSTFNRDSFLHQEWLVSLENQNRLTPYQESFELKS